MKKLAEYQGVNVIPLQGKDLVTYENHRYVFAVLWYAKHVKRLFDEPVTFVFFDYHHDYTFIDEDQKKALSALMSGEPGMKGVWDFVENCLSSINDDWLSAAMEAGLIGNVVRFWYGQKEPAFFRESYEDQRGLEHKIWSISSLRQAINCHQGCLFDQCGVESYTDLWKELDWKPAPFPQGFGGAEDKKGIVLDFDLDFLSCVVDESNYAWPAEAIDLHLSAPGSQRYMYGWNVGLFLKALAEKTAVVTVAKESDCCGGKDQSEKIFRKLDSYVFNNAVFGSQD